VSIDRSPAPLARTKRSRETQNRIFAAGFRLLEAGGPEALTMVAVAAEAEVSVGSIYRRFGDKERLLLAIQTGFTDQFRVEFQRQLAGSDLSAATPPAEVIGAAVTGMAKSFQAHASLLRVFLLLGLNNPAVLEHGTEIGIEGGRAFRDLVMLAAPALRHHQDVEAAIDFAYRLVYAACAHRVEHGEHLESRRALPWTELIEQLRRTVTAYLLCPVAESAASGE
jgi:AcrR family transcriptional regulator